MAFFLGTTCQMQDDDVVDVFLRCRPTSEVFERVRAVALRLPCFGDDNVRKISLSHLHRHERRDDDRRRKRSNNGGGDGVRRRTGHETMIAKPAGPPLPLVGVLNRLTDTNYERMLRVVVISTTTTTSSACASEDGKVREVVSTILATCVNQPAFVDLYLRFLMDFAKKIEEMEVPRATSTVPDVLRTFTRDFAERDLPRASHIVRGDDEGAGQDGVNDEHDRFCMALKRRSRLIAAGKTTTRILLVYAGGDGGVAGPSDYLARLRACLAGSFSLSAAPPSQPPPPPPFDALQLDVLLDVLVDALEVVTGAAAAGAAKTRRATVNGDDHDAIMACLRQCVNEATTGLETRSSDVPNKCRFRILDAVDALRRTTENCESACQHAVTAAADTSSSSIVETAAPVRPPRSSSSKQKAKQPKPKNLDGHNRDDALAGFTPTTRRRRDDRRLTASYRRHHVINDTARWR